MEAQVFVGPIEWFEKDYYRVLGVAPDASTDEIVRAFRAQARCCHPDAVPGDRRAEERFKELSVAFSVLRDARRRADYDVVRRSVAAATTWYATRLSATGGLGGVPYPWGAPSSDVMPPWADGGAAQPAGDSAVAAGPSGEEAVQRTVWLSNVDARDGCVAAVDVIDDVPCVECGGRGAASAGSVQRCPLCAGRGTLPRDYGGFSLTGSCPACFGRGWAVDEPCHACHGAGVVGRRRSIRFRVPPGVSDGQHLRVRGHGGPGRHGGPPGDLDLTIRIHPPPNRHH
jgi:molecular chaperone DnaJ